MSALNFSQPVLATAGFVAGELSDQFAICCLRKQLLEPSSQIFVAACLSSIRHARNLMMGSPYGETKVRGYLFPKTDQSRAGETRAFPKSIQHCPGRLGGVVGAQVREIGGRMDAD